MNGRETKATGGYIGKRFREGKKGRIEAKGRGLRAAIGVKRREVKGRGIEESHFDAR